MIVVDRLDLRDYNLSNIMLILVREGLALSIALCAVCAVGQYPALFDCSSGRGTPRSTTAQFGIDSDFA